MLSIGRQRQIQTHEDKPKPSRTKENLCHPGSAPNLDGENDLQKKLATCTEVLGSGCREPEGRAPGQADEPVDHSVCV